MWISSLFQTGMRKLLILGLISSLAACGGGGGGGKKPDPVPPSSSPVSSSSSSALSSSSSSSPLSSSLNSSSVSSLGNSSNGSSLSSSQGASSIGSLGNSSRSSTSSLLVVPIDTTPDSFSLTAVTGAALNANVTSAAITISGINTAAPISIANGEYSINGGAFTSAAGTVTNGQTVVVSLATAATLGATTQATLTIGGVAQIFSVTTELPDTAPNAFSFTAVTGAALSANVTSAAITISGINTATLISITGGQYSIAGGAATSAAGTITNGQTVVVSLTTAATLGATTQATLTVGGVARTFSATTELPDTTPNTFSFTAVTGAALNANANSTAITVSGINTASPISITGGQYSIAGGAATSAAGTITNGQTVVVSLTTAATLGATTQATLTVGGVARIFSVTTELPDTTPNAFSFTAITGAALSTTISSAAVTISGINTTTPISITGGQYSIAGGAFTSAAGTITNGQTVALRLMSAATVSTVSQSAVTIGGITSAFSVTTTNILGGAVQGAPLNIAGVVTTVAGTPPSADGVGTAAGFNVPKGTVVIDAYLYVADSSNNKIRKIEIATGVVTTLAGIGSQGSADGAGAAASFNRPEGITTDGTHLYVVDRSNNKIRKIEIATGVVTTLAGSGSLGGTDGTGAAASFRFPSGITTDGTHLYVADRFNNRIRQIVIATGVVTTLAGSGSSGSADGIGTAASFYYPTDITTDGTHLFVADYNNRKIRKIVIATGVVTTLAGSGSSGSTDGTGAAASFYSPEGITTDGTHLYVSDTSNHKIRKIEIATRVVTTLAGSGSLGGADGTGVAAGFNQPAGISTDGTHLYVADSYNNKIRKINIATAVVTTLAGSGPQGDGTGTAARFYSPDGITTDGTHLYVADRSNNKIRKIEIATGVVTTLAGSGSNGSADGTGAVASFWGPRGLTTDGTHLYVADEQNHKIRKIEIATGVVTTLAGSGSNGSADGTSAAASFYYPGGITTDGTHLYVADTYNDKIRKIEIATGVVTTLAGSGSEGSADGTGAAASFYYPGGITTDGTHLYVADTYNDKIRKIEIATGVVTTLAGSGSNGSADGTGVAASFDYPGGITTDGAHLYVADTYNSKIRKIVIATGVVTTLAGSGASGIADGVGTAASFDNPIGITTDGFALFVADTENNTIRKIE